MKFITYKRFKDKALSGSMNIPYGAELEGLLYYKNNPVCLVSSEYGLKHFIRNDDNTGLERADTILSIEKILHKDKTKWNLIWEDKSLERFRKSTIPDYWLWNSDFYSAQIEDLQYIYKKLQ